MATTLDPLTAQAEAQAYNNRTLGIASKPVYIPPDTFFDVRNQNKLNYARNKQAKQDLGTGETSNERVNTSSKAVSKDISNGGGSFYKYSHKRYGGSPNSVNKSLKAVDYYRTGLFTNVTVPVPGGKSIVEKKWNPIPELVTSTSDNYEGVLSSIKIVDPSKPDKSKDGTSSNNLVPEFSKFFLESVSESHKEKVQIVETFNDFYAFFYGESPPIYTFSGHLLNLKNYNWMNEFMYYYQNFWRGTKMVELNAKMYLTYNYQQIQGYILGVSTNLNSITDKAAPFSIQVLITDRRIFNGINGDKIIRDNLIPTREDGYVNINASKFSLALTKKVLLGTAPASGMDIINDTNTEEGTDTISRNDSSTVKEKPAGPDSKLKAFGKSLPASDVIKNAGSTANTSIGKLRAFNIRGLF